VSSDSPIVFKIASSDSEFALIHRLNYKTFVEEIPQHSSNPDRSLVDRFNEENTYFICLRGAELLGMIAMRDKRPFSLDYKLDNLDFYLPQACSICELRLLAVDPNHRTGVIFRGLGSLVLEHWKTQGYDIALISGTVRQQKLYQSLGFIPFGPLVGTEGAKYQPMYLTSDAADVLFNRFLGRGLAPAGEQPPTNLLPGPVEVVPETRKAFADQPISHRAEAFKAQFQRTKELLCELVNSRHVEILLGSGTLANDVVAGQLTLLGGRGLILSNGEFGDRLIDHATGFGLSFRALRIEWGEAFTEADLRWAIASDPMIEWLWAVHCETSTGILNDLEMLKGVCAERGIRLCLDCVSSIGNVAVDLEGVFLTSGVSGKGLGAFPGLSMVFYNHEVRPGRSSLPRYLDLGLYVQNDGIPFTHSSNLLRALQAAAERKNSARLPGDQAVLGSWLRSRLRALGFEIVGADEYTAPAVITIALPAGLNSESIGRQLEAGGYMLSYMSEYLLRRNWIQICPMSEYPRTRFAQLLELLREQVVGPWP
jgi:aspartate aminotransferase-like enzyme